MRHYLNSMLVVGLFLAHQEAARAAIVPGLINRRVDAISGPDGVPGGVHDLNAAPGLYIGAVADLGIGAAGTVSTSANQLSNVLPGLTLDGMGDVHAATSATGLTGFSVFARSLYDVTFTVDAAATFDLTAKVSWVGSAPPYGAGAIVELRNLTTATSVASVSRSAGAQGPAMLATSFLLMPGNTYNLTAAAQIDGGFASAGAFVADADWMFLLATTIPEVNALWVLSPLGVGAAFWGARRRRTAGPR
jgi:hypothetical protein